MTPTRFQVERFVKGRFFFFPFFPTATSDVGRTTRIRSSSGHAHVSRLQNKPPSDGPGANQTFEFRCAHLAGPSRKGLLLRSMDCWAGDAAEGVFEVEKSERKKRRGGREMARDTAGGEKKRRTGRRRPFTWKRESRMSGKLSAGNLEASDIHQVYRTFLGHQTDAASFQPAMPIRALCLSPPLSLSLFSPFFFLLFFSPIYPPARAPRHYENKKTDP